MDAAPGLHTLRVGVRVGSISGNSGLSSYISLLFWNNGAALYEAGGVEVMTVGRYHAQLRSRSGGVVFSFGQILSDFNPCSYVCPY